MIVYRCCSAKWAKDITGMGSFMYGGRWNYAGTYMVYTAENNVLAALEVALRIPLEDISKDYVMIPFDVPSDAEVTEPSLPKQWYLNIEATKTIGNNFLVKGNTLLMKVPSALISDSFNYLINPAHEGIKKVKVLDPRPILFDKRLMDLIRSSASKK
jgi:RES domain-containing protein